MQPIQTRRAGLEDAETLSVLGRETFVETFGHLYPPEDLAAFLTSAYAPQAFRDSLNTADEAIWLAEANGRAVGYVQAGACCLPHPAVGPWCGEVRRLYVLRPYQNGGLGGTLFRTALDWLDAPGRDLWVGVWSGNHGAQRFYARHGFEKVGEYDFPVGQTQDREFILRRA